jgi:DNA polymerase-3 subunit epsilon
LLKFAVVDLETTGGHKELNRIMEIGIALMDGSDIVDTYHALVDPGHPITPFVRELTGISDEMVQGQPQFSSIAEHVA